MRAGGSPWGTPPEVHIDMVGDETFMRLYEQVGFLRRSLEWFFREPAEAQRLAVSLRVLVHDTAASTALLRQLNGNYLEMPVPDETYTFIQNATQGGGELWSVVNFTVTPPGRFPPDCTRLPLGEWWSVTPVYVAGDEALGGPRRFTRRDLVLTLANKLGGAHIDPQGPPEPYRRLIVERPVRTPSGTVDQAYVAVARAAAEVIDALEQVYPELRM